MAELRPIQESEVDAFISVMAGAFYERPDPWHVRQFRAEVPTSSTIAAFKRGLFVGTSAALPMTLSVPGSRSPARGITAVGVTPTHRRRGLLRAMMDQQLRQARAGKIPVAILWASEGSIYGRFGFGPATQRVQLRLERRGTELIETTASGPLKMVGREEALRLMPKVYDRALSARPGLIARSSTAWELLTADDDPQRPAGEAHNYFVLHGDRVDGYAIYRVRRVETDEGPGATAVVTEVIAEGPGAAADLWRFLLTLDLVTKVERRSGPVDDPIIWLVRNPQAIELRLEIGIWARVLDVPSALEGRRYQADGELVLDVSDPFIPEASGTYRLRVQDGVAICGKADHPADLRLGIAELSSGYLGETCFSAMARAGRIEEISAGGDNGPTSCWVGTLDRGALTASEPGKACWTPG